MQYAMKDHKVSDGRIKPLQDDIKQSGIDQPWLCWPNQLWNKNVKKVLPLYFLFLFWRKKGSSGQERNNNFTTLAALSNGIHLLSYLIPEYFTLNTVAAMRL